MNYEANIAEEQVRQNNATLFKDDTKEDSAEVRLEQDDAQGVQIPNDQSDEQTEEERLQELRARQQPPDHAAVDATSGN